MATFLLAFSHEVGCARPSPFHSIYLSYVAPTPCPQQVLWIQIRIHWLHMFLGPPGSGSGTISQRYGSLISTVL
jgi:hypothetical protein